MPKKYLLTISTILLLWTTSLLAASFDCAKAQTKVEHLVCNTPLLSTLDEALAKEYQDVLVKATNAQKKALIQDQRHWLNHARNSCPTVVCLTHAYYSRQAALETYLHPRSPLYKNEADKAPRIQKILKSTGLSRVYDLPICNQIYDGLIHKKGVEFIDPIAQTQSYEDPALDPWKKSCHWAPPFNFSYFCEPNIIPGDAQDVLHACKAAYGLPPFKIYELPGSKGKREGRTIFYSDDSYGYMNRPNLKKYFGYGFVGFQEIDTSKCLAPHGNHWAKEEWTEDHWPNISLRSDKQGTNELNYNSLIKYKDDYYFLVFYKDLNRYWLTIKPVEPSKTLCRWAS